jgi:HEPN domain-containing protein
LFIAQLSLEKILKAYFVKERNEVPPKFHKVDKNAELPGLPLNDDQIELLRLVNEFNLQARYPDYKKKFKTICTKEFSNEYLLKIKIMHQWMIEKLKD